MILTTTAVTTAGLQTGVLDLVWQSGWAAKAVLFLLLAASVFSWAVISLKYKVLKAAKIQSQGFLNVFWSGHDLDEIFSKIDQFPKSPVAAVFKSGFKELKKLSSSQDLQNKSEIMRNDGIQNITRALNRSTLAEIENLESKVGILASIASSTPFIGLFGTVWGVMNSFQGIGATGTASLAVVAPGISEALITTAAGLAAAIPAVMSYNYFVGKIKSLATDMDTFSQDFLNIVHRSLLKG